MQIASVYVFGINPCVASSMLTGAGKSERKIDTHFYQPKKELPRWVFSRWGGIVSDLSTSSYCPYNPSSKNLRVNACVSTVRATCLRLFAQNEHTV